MKRMSAAVIVAIAIILAGCSSSGSKVNSATQSPGSNGTAAAQTTSSAAIAQEFGFPAPLTGPATMAELTPRVAQYTATPTKFIGLQPLPKKAPTGKTVADLVCGIPVCSQFADGMQQAASLLGWKFIRIPLGVTPEAFANAYTQAIQDHPDLVIGSGLSRSYFNAQLQTLGQMHIPVLEWSAPMQVGNGVTAVLYDPPMYQESGRMLSEFIAADSNLNAHVVVVNVTQYGDSNAQTQEMDSYLPRICAKCTIANLNVNATDVGTNVPSEVVGYISAHPDINYVMCASSFCEGVAAALRDAGKGSIKIVSRDSDTTDLQNVKNGLEYAALPLPPIQTGWQIIDCAQRIFLNLSCAQDRISPMQIVTQKDITNPSSPAIGAVTNFQAIFKKLWLLG